jgi:hypothetical protein
VAGVDLKMKSETLWLILGLAALLAIVVCVGGYVRTGGSDVFLITSLAAVLAGLALVVSAFALRKADLRVQIVWCIFAMILIRSVQLWKAGIDFRDELRFIDISKRLFEEGQFLGYLRYYPVNIPFAAVFYGLYSVWHDTEVFELLALMVYPLLVLGYSFMAKEISKMKSYRALSEPVIPAVLFLPFAPTFSIIPTYYWPQLLGLAVLLFATGCLVRFMNTEPEKLRPQLAIVAGLSVVLVFTHSVSSSLYVLTIFFFWLASRDKREKRILVWIGLITIIAFAAAHLIEYWSILVAVLQAISGDAAAWRYLESFSFPDLGSAARQGIFMTVAHTGFYFVVGILALGRVFRRVHTGDESGLHLRRAFSSLVGRLRDLRRDPILLSFFGFGVVTVLSAAFFGGNFFDPVRMIGWACLLALPVLVPRNRVVALVFVVVLLFLFFLLVWTVNSPWGSPLGSSQNLNNS